MEKKKMLKRSSSSTLIFQVNLVLTFICYLSSINQLVCAYPAIIPNLNLKGSSSKPLITGSGGGVPYKIQEEEKHFKNYSKNAIKEIRKIEDDRILFKRFQSESTISTDSLTSGSQFFNKTSSTQVISSSSSSLTTLADAGVGEDSTAPEYLTLATEAENGLSKNGGPLVKRESSMKPNKNAVNNALDINDGHTGAGALGVISTFRRKPSVMITGIRVQDTNKGVNYEDNHVSVFLVNEPAKILLVGSGISNKTQVRFVTEPNDYGKVCDASKNASETYTVSEVSKDRRTAIITPIFHSSTNGKLLYICTKESDDSDDRWVHQGQDPWLTIKTCQRLLPFWIQAIFIGLLLLMSGLFAGLTLGLLALDRTDLKILSSTGSEREKRYANTIIPLRERGNYLLCSLVLGNVLVNSTLTILLDDLTSGLIAVIFATAGIVIFGEIIPQAVCSRYGLEIGAKTIWITKFLMIITFPLSFTISFILDKILGEEIGFVYNREKLKELITVTSDHNDLEADEVNIISGALTMRKKTVEDIMTPLDEIYMLPLESFLDFSTLSEIRSQGYSRVPIYEKERTNIVSVLHTKDLIFVDPDNCTPLRQLAEYHSSERFFLLGDTTLDVVFKEFNETKRGHTAFVQRIKISDERDPIYETIGLITLEDVIEELIQYNRQIKVG